MIGTDTIKFGKITEDIKENLEYDINYKELKNIRTIIVSSLGGQDGLTTSLLEYLAMTILSLIQKTILEVREYSDKYEKLAEVG